MTIYNDIRYTDDDGRVVVRRVPLEGNPPGYKPFVGEDQILIIDTVNGREHDMPIRFPIPVGEQSFKKSILEQVKEAFENYDAAKLDIQRKTQEEVSLAIAAEIAKKKAAEEAKPEPVKKTPTVTEAEALSPEVVAALSAMTNG